MSFFKDLKEDIAQSVNELTESLDENLNPDSNEQEVEVKADFMQNLTEEDVTDVPVEDLMDLQTLDQAPSEVEETDQPVSNEGDVSELSLSDLDVAGILEKVNESEAEEVVAAAEEEEETVVLDEPVEEIVLEPENIVENEEVPVAMSEEVKEEVLNQEEDDRQEVTVITKGTTISGGIKSDTSLVVKGTIEGDVECEGKLTITGRVAGNTIASEIYVNTPRLEGDINSKGIVKIDVGTVVIGNVNCTSVVVAGAVKGNIEVNGPVVVDSTAVVKGDIKAKSIQINSGAVIDGHCSLQFADVDLDSFFE
ncbi:MAG: polymer-forming cytoskeletal protein [Eubacterium sp.]|nr:polymer-forming cytoskeletal protein [Eubacterium sp.]